MPMILWTAPARIRPILCQKVDAALQAALRAEGVKGGITIWPVRLTTNSPRLLLEYKSRQEVQNPNHLAQVMGRVVSQITHRETEVVVMKLDSVTTGLHIAPKG